MKTDKKTDRLIGGIVTRLKKYNPDKVMIFGSYARGNYTSDSDIDLLIIKKGVSKVKPYIRVYQALQHLPKASKVEPRVYSPEEVNNIPSNNFFLREALSEGRVIYEKK